MVERFFIRLEEQTGGDKAMDGFFFLIQQVFSLLWAIVQMKN